MAISKLILNGEVQMDVTSDTVIAAKMLSGTTATKNDGTKITGNITTKTSNDLTVSGATVTAPAGYYANAASKAVTTTTHPNPTASITSSTGVVTASHTQTAGYVTAGTTTGTLNLTSKAAATYYPSTADQTIASYRWLTGNQTIKSVTTSNLTATNIKSGVVVKVGDSNNASRITQITGTLVEGEDVPVFTRTFDTGYTTETITCNKTFAQMASYYQEYNQKNPAIVKTFVGSELRETTGAVINKITEGSSFYYVITMIGEDGIPGGEIIYTSTSITSAQTRVLSDLYVDRSGYFVAPEGKLWNLVSVPSGSAFPPATTITKAPTFSMNSSTGVVTASYTGSSSITPTVTSGWVSRGTAGTISTTGTSTYQLTSKAAATIYPSTADQTISSYRWLTGTQTIKSVTTSNLTAANIAEGVVVQVGDSSNASRIAQITGIHSGGAFTTTISNGDYDPATYVECKGVKYYNNGDTFTYNPGDTIKFYVYTGRANSIYINDEIIASSDVSPVSYNLVAPSCPIEIHLAPAAGLSTIRITIPQLDIDHNGKYSLEGYGYADVNVANENGFTADQVAMRDMFGDISGNATSIYSNAFYSCYRLTAANFPSCTTIGGSAFRGCSGLTTISFPSCTTISNYAFYGCSSLTAAIFPVCTSIGGSAFAYCSNLTTASFSIITIINGNVFSYCRSLTTVSFPSCTIISSSAFFGCYALSIVSFPVCTTISYSAFAYCSSLTTASFPSCTIISIGAFYGCSNLTTVSFPVCTTISSIAFANCRSLTTISFPSCTMISNSAFYSCYGLLSLYLLGSSVPTLGTGAFLSTPIGGYTNSTGGVYGKIFVPSSLYNTYVTATNWATYSSRIVSM